MSSIHPPVLTDYVTNPLLHSAGEFFESVGLDHGALNNIFNAWIVMLLLIIPALILRSKLEIVPKGLQNFWEVVVRTLDDLVTETMGEQGRPYMPLIATLALFIVSCNLLGVIPYFQSSTNNLNTTLALALVAFVVTHWVGITHHGFHYVKHFMGPVPWLIPLMMPIEIISHLSRILSLSFRLFGNIMGEDLAVAMLTLLLPYLVPLPMLFLMVFTSFIQALVFIMLTMMYIVGSLEEAH
jgi:F-type H+-transporting ATPase subunit a